ncbi:hypothetical protein CWC22_001075 [Pseudoalteromonas rubra]|uniref:Bacterial repeat domain-containing protein n=1 Tax=Pseudoalteromonas rubra TaxID=43658 RepID=A0A5S3UYX8_9GAMM|nr:hypothetical protein [Pseudoalteromonas rubra]QPB81680.1 hypothetical protein CWC22_001075 [Pseudoalteromonas rubra]
MNYVIKRTLVLVMALSQLTACSGGSGDSSAPKDTPDLLTISAHSEGGGVLEPASLQVGKGKAAEFVAKPRAGYELVALSGCGGKRTGVAYRVERVEQSCQIQARFSPIQYRLDATVSQGGNVDISTQQIAHGSAAEFVFTPNSDHILERVGGCNGTLTQYTYHLREVTGPCTVSALFLPYLPEPEALTRIRLPVVVHVLNNGHFELSDAQILSQLRATNLHFRGKNSAEIETIPDTYSPFVADTGIQFYLADKDPDGQPHSGIVRVDATTSVFALEGYPFARSDAGGSDAWPTDRYINIWVGMSRTRFNEPVLGGRAHVPGMAPELYIGVSVEQGLFGTIAPREPNYDQGKTLTHELGHFLGLIGHTNPPWNDQNTHRHLTCDGLAQTECVNADLTMNFMNTNVYDNRQKMFSLSQRQLMRAWLETGPLQALYLNNPP